MDASWAGTAALSGLILFLPFEPRAQASLFGLHVSLLELAAALSGVVLVWIARSRVAVLRARPPLALVGLALFAAAHGLAALLAVSSRAAGARFALRMAALAGFAALVALAPRRARRAGLLALAGAGGMVTLLAIAESGGVHALDPFLDLFREMRFNVGGAPRVSAGTAYPTLAAVWIGCGLLAAVGRALASAHPLRWAVAASLAATPALLATYSRGAAAAAGAGLLALAWAAARVVSPRAGAAALAAAAVLAGGASLQAARREVFRLRFTAENARAWYGASYEPSASALELEPGEARATDVQVRNTGTLPWAAGGEFALSYHWFEPGHSPLLDGGRTPLGGALEPGAARRLRATVVAPFRAGCYLLVWDMVQEHTTWFSGQGVTPVNVPVRVGHPAADCAAFLQPRSATAWQPGRAELWRLALRMWRDHPLTGVGPDNYRRLYGPYAGHEFWDERVTANNLFLETAATTGAFGLLALLAALAAAFRAAARGLEAATAATGAQAATLLALLVALCVHGCVDYVLGFTGPYLLLAFVVGSLSALPDGGLA